MIVCPKCGKENQDHYKFCLGCGNELPRDAGGGNRPFRPTPPAVNVPATAGRPAAQPVQPMPPQVAPPPQQQPFAPPPQQPFAPPPQQQQPFAPPPQQQPFAPPPQQQQPFAPPPQQQPFAPPPQQPFAAQPPGPFGPPPQPPVAQPPVAQPPVAQPPVAQPPVAQPTAAGGIPASCPNCGSPNPRGNRFCITCGFDMASAAAQAPVAQAPVVQAPVAQAPVAQPPVANVAPTPPARPAAVERGRLVLIRPDGSEGGAFPLHEGEVRVGRESGPMFQQDTYLSPRHASFAVAPGSITVRDEGSLNGVYVRVERQVPVEINDGDVFRIGQEILRYDAFGPIARQPDGTERIGSESEGLVGRISLVTGRDTYGNAFPVPVTGLYLGRERGDILFPEDGYVSGLHCQLAVNNGRLTLTDVGSSNGSYLRIRGQRALRNGDYLLMGQQLFRLQVI